MGDKTLIRTVFPNCPICLAGSINQYKEKLYLVLTSEYMACSNCNAKFKEIGLSPQNMQKFKIENSENLLNGRILYSNDFENAKKGNCAFVVKCINTLKNKPSQSQKITVSFQSIEHPTGIILKKDEELLFDDYCVLMEERAERRYQSGFSGMRVAKGFYVGGSQGHSYSEYKLKKIDKGDIKITSKRIIFSGGFKNIEIKNSSINHISFGKDYIEIGETGREKKRYFVSDDGYTPYLFMNGILTGNLSKVE